MSGKLLEAYQQHIGIAGTHALCTSCHQACLLLLIGFQLVLPCQYNDITDKTMYFPIKLRFTADRRQPWRSSSLMS